MARFKNKNLEIRQNYFAEKSLFRERRVVFVGLAELLIGDKFVEMRKSAHASNTETAKAKLEAKVKKHAAEQELKKTTKAAESNEAIMQMTHDFRLKMAEQGVVLDKDSNPVVALSKKSADDYQNTAPDSAALIEGPTTKISILKNIPITDRKKQQFLAERINDLLAGKGIKNNDKKDLLQNSGEAILKEIDPSYARPSSGNYALETQKVVAKALNGVLAKETIEKALKGDANSERLVAKKIEQIYDVLEHARNRTHAKEIRQGTRNLLRPALLRVNSSVSKKHRKDLNLLDRFERNGTLQNKLETAFSIEEDPAKKEAAEVAAQEKNAAWKPTSKIGKFAYYGPAGIPFLAHRLALRPIKLSAQFIGEKIIKPPVKFLWDKTFGKGPVIGTARTALWVLGSGVTGGIPAIPVAVESAIWAANKIKPGEKAEKVKDETIYVLKNLLNVVTLGIPRFLIGGVLFKKVWPFIELKRKPKPTKPSTK